MDVEDEHGDVGRVGWTRLASPNYSQALTGTGEINFPRSDDHGKDWQPYPVDVQFAEKDDDTVPTFILT